jgi:hypothetical protein
MKAILIATSIFIFNTLFMPIIGMAHEYSHANYEGASSISWSENEPSNGLFLIVHDEHRLKADLSSEGTHIDQHQCHHISVLGIPTYIVPQSRTSEKIFNLIEPLFSIQSFPNLIEYLPKNT